MTTTERRPAALRAAAIAVLAGMLAIAAAQTPAPENHDLPITKVVHFTTGVAYVEHTGTVHGDADVELRVPPDAMDDLLQSLVLEDAEGRVEPVRYGTRDPLGRILASYPLDLSRDPSFAELLSQARGEEVHVQTDVALSGVIVGVERRQVSGEAPEAFLTLHTAHGLRRVDLADVRALRFERDALRAQLDEALAAISSYRDATEVPVHLRFSGEGTREVRVGYLRAMPVWKTSYRLQLGADGADLQGWAIFDNPTSLDFEGVEVVFVAGQPASFVSQLFEPVHLERPRVAAPSAASFVPPTDAGALREIDHVARSAMMPSAAPAMEADAAFADAFDPRSDGVEAMAEGAAGGATFAYVVREPVTVRRFESVLVPILRAQVEAYPVSLFDAGVDARHPLRGVRIVNDTGLHLAPGPVTVFDPGGFTGTALLADLVPGDDRVLSYARDLDLAFDVSTSSEPERVMAARVVGGLLESEHRSRLRATYLIAARTEVERFVVIDHARRSGYHVVAPQPTPPLTPTSHRLGVALVPAGADAAALPDDPSVPTHLVCEGADDPCLLEVVLERVEARRVALSSVPLERLEVYLSDVDLSEQTRTQLEAVADLQRELVRLQRAIQAERARRDTIYADQARLRQNMAALDRTSSLYRRYVDELTHQEDVLADIAHAIEALEAEREKQQEALDTLIEGFGRD